uniref:LRRCT domain-containing protein n=1 Tax=Monopterus albus TaxID=43700 RepID=A0A3Q3RCM4_MONAL
MPILLCSTEFPLRNIFVLVLTFLSSGLQVNCSALNLMELPPLPSDTTELHMQDNKLTSVSLGQFHRLVSLKKVSLSGNPFHCGCRIQYPRNWLRNNGTIVLTEPPPSASPSSVAQKAIAELRGLLFFLCPDKLHSEFEAGSLHSMKPKHRRGLHNALSEVNVDSHSLTSAEAPGRLLLNMDLLPQVVDMLHKKHNIKIKMS